MRHAPPLLLSGAIVLAYSAAGTVQAQTWDANKVYNADTGGAANPLRYIDADGGFLGWSPGDTAGTIINDPPVLFSGQYGNFFRVIAGKEKHTTANWVLDGASSTRTALFWRLYVPASPTITRFPSIQIRTHNLRHHLDFKPDVTDGGSCLPGTSGWVDAEQAVITSGGKVIPGGGGGLFLPMSMDAWHTIRVEVFANGDYEAWIDEEDGLTDVQHIVADANKEGGGNYIEIGVRNSGNSSQYYTNFLAFGQDTTATGGTDEIDPLPAVPVEICDNSIDDDGDSLTDCEEPGCLCAVASEQCGNGIDDDLDGLADCADSDCAGATLCGDTEPHFALTLVRQIGNWQNDCGFCKSAIYFSVYDENGEPLNGVTLRDPLNCVEVTTFDPDGAGGDQQAGHVRHSPAAGLVQTVYQFYVSQDNGQLVSSDVTPLLYANLPPHFQGSAWQVEFQRIPERRDVGAYTPTDPMYVFDGVELNEPPGNNPTLPDDASGLGDVDYQIGGAGVLMGQTFKASGNRVVSARVEASIGFGLTFQYQLSVHELLNNPPASLADIGPQIGPTRLGPADMFDSEFWQQMILWPLQGNDSVPVTPGETYFLKIERADVPGGELNVFVTNPDDDYYPDGMQFRQPLAGVLANDHANYDVVGYVVGATVEEPDPCRDWDPVFDANTDTHVDAQDLVAFDNCYTGPAIPLPGGASQLCLCMDTNGDLIIDHQDYGAFQACHSGTIPADPTCDD